MSKPLIFVTETTRQPPQALEEFMRERRESFIGKLQSTESAQAQ